MKLMADDGVWTTGPLMADIPLVAVLEVSGAVLSWPVDTPGAPPRVAFTDVTRADWLWRVVGETGHAALLDALTAPATAVAPLDVPGVEMSADAVSALRRLALGHWLRRWWPASRVDGLADLDRAVLDGELAVLTAAAEDFFTDDTVDSDAAELLAPHLDELGIRAQLGDPRLAELGAACAELAGDLGIAAAVGDRVAGRRDDYALVAGTSGGPAAGPIARGTGPVAWSAVPPGVFDATENAVSWSVHAVADAVTAEVRTVLLGDRSPAGIPVTVSSGTVGGAGVLDGSGRAALTLRRDGATLAETAAWDHDWQATVVTVGAGAAESPDARDRVRRFARARLDGTAADAFLAEVLAAEDDY
jgi:hypothetical protein